MFAKNRNLIEDLYAVLHNGLLCSAKKTNMKKILLFASMLISFSFSQTSLAQSADRFAYAITDLQSGQSGHWNYLRKIDLSTGLFSPVLLDGIRADKPVYNAVSKNQFLPSTVDAPFAKGVAALAYDKNNNRLYFTPMFIDQLRYIDLQTMQVYYYADQSFTGQPQKSADQGNIVTRMVMASDGFGYAMTNDARQLIRFSTGKNFTVTDLGAVVDDPSNKNVSIHNACSSFGGDMIADNDGHLFIISARNFVFKINIETKVAQYLGVIAGLPSGFTSNAAAVTDQNQIIVGSALQAKSFFTVDYKTLKATPAPIAGDIWQTSDMANSNLLITNTNKLAPPIVVMDEIERNGNGNISVFPNPVTDRKFVLQMNNLDRGAYTMQLTDLMGRVLSQQAINLSGKRQANTVHIPQNTANGFYMVKVLNANKKLIAVTKILIE